MPFDWNSTFNEDAYSTQHPCHKCFFRCKHPHHYDGPEWNCTTTVVWECCIKHQGLRIILFARYEHKSRKKLELTDYYRQRFENNPCTEKSVL